MRTAPPACAAAAAAAVSTRRVSLTKCISLLANADNWGKKAIGRKTTGTGRCRYIKALPRKFKNGFREGALPPGEVRLDPAAMTASSFTATCGVPGAGKPRLCAVLAGTRCGACSKLEPWSSPAPAGLLQGLGLILDSRCAL